ncbi:MAG: hypothetical protein U5K43_01605 [Halofilum sp. (in: g-proteobacteria)]|nr:hypothetical protein [Halofilum sp. (in: g-proteobacteria)]
MRAGYELGSRRECSMKARWSAQRWHGMKFPPGLAPGRTASLDRRPHHAQRYPDHGIADVWAALRRDPNAEPGPPSDALVFDGKPRTRHYVENKWSEVRRKRKQAAEQARAWLHGLSTPRQPPGFR